MYVSFPVASQQYFYRTKANKTTRSVSMAVEVLKTQEENKIARSEMRLRGIDCVSPIWQRLLNKIGLRKDVNVGDKLKSWDVLKSIQFIEKNVPHKQPILDVGTYGSEMLCSLYRLKYTDLTGVDLNTGIQQMPFNNTIRYVVSDFMKTPFPDESFAAITATSVIEHGFQSKHLLTEVARILRPGGYFIASIDYWPQKIETSNIEVYGMDWMIFSENDVRSFFEEAKEFGLHPCGAMDFTAHEKVITWSGKSYTFAWLALQKL